MDNQPLVSILMNCYNGEKYLKEALDSIYAQTYQNWEILFWDNQSTDNSVGILKSYGEDDRIKYFFAENFTNLGKARKLAIDKANGDWIAFLDVDDRWSCEKLLEFIIKLNNNPTCKLFFSQTMIINDKGENLKYLDKLFYKDIYYSLLSYGNFISQSSIIIEKKAYYLLGGLNDKLTFCPDYDLLLKASKHCDFMCSDKVLSFYRVHGDNYSSKKYFNNGLEYIKLLRNEIKNNKLPRFVKFNVYLNLSYSVTTLIIKSILKREFKQLIYMRRNFLFILLFPFAIIKKKFLK